MNNILSMASQLEFVEIITWVKHIPRDPPHSQETADTVSRMMAPRAITLAMYGPNHPTHRSCIAPRKPTFPTPPGNPSSSHSSRHTKTAAAWHLRPEQRQLDQCGTRRFCKTLTAPARRNPMAGPRALIRSPGPLSYPPDHPG